METTKSELFQVGEILRIWENNKFRVWRVVGVHYAGIGQEDIITLKPLDLYPGTAFGKVMTETTMPLSILSAVSFLGRNQ